jgi:glutamine amidotransferase PdxT
MHSSSAFDEMATAKRATKRDDNVMTMSFHPEATVNSIPRYEGIRHQWKLHHRILQLDVILPSHQRMPQF